MTLITTLPDSEESQKVYIRYGYPGNDNWDFSGPRNIFTLIIAQELSRTFLLGATINFGPLTFSDFTFIF